MRVGHLQVTRLDPSDRNAANLGAGTTSESTIGAFVTYISVTVPTGKKYRIDQAIMSLYAIDVMTTGTYGAIQIFVAAVLIGRVSLFNPRTDEGRAVTYAPVTTAFAGQQCSGTGDSDSDGTWAIAIALRGIQYDA